MDPRTSLIDRLLDLVGRDIVKVFDLRDGWPSLVQIYIRDEAVLAALHIGRVSLSGRGRDEVERRIQNPTKGRFFSAPDGAFPLILGIEEAGPRPVLVGMDAEARMSRNTRQSMFFPLRLLQQAALAGWAEHRSTTKELIISFHPALLPTYVEVRRSHLPSFPVSQVSEIVEASGLIDPMMSPAERARRASYSLVRSAQFSRRVIEAYGGFCAMCGLDFGLVEGAHIYPVSAPGSPDEVWNGLALCNNHHAAFDRHLLWVDPTSKAIKIHPDIVQDSPRSRPCRFFAETTYPSLGAPSAASDVPKPEMFLRRYEFFENNYRWAH